MHIIISLLIYLITTSNSLASSIDNRIRVVTSISSLASIFSTIGGDAVRVTSLANSNVCPHNYVVRPSQMWHVKNAQIVAFIDNDFETFIIPMLEKKAQNEIFKISNISGIKILYSKNNNANWHIWLDVSNIKLIMEGVLHLLSSIDSKNTEMFTKNYLVALKQLNDTDQKMKSLLSNVKQRYVILSPSLEYFFANSAIKPESFHIHNSMRKVDELVKFVNERNIRYVFISNEQDLASFSNMFKNNVKVIQLESENWSISSNYNNLLFEKLNQMIKIASSYLN